MNNFLKISEAASIGLHAIIVLAQNNKVMSVKAIASKLNVSANHLSKILQRLNKAGYIESIKGNNGGFKILVNPKNLTFLEIYETIDGKLRLSNCLLSNQACKSNCVFGDLISSINTQVKEKFEKTKLSEFLK